MWPVTIQTETDILFSLHLPKAVIFLFHHMTLKFQTFGSELESS